jgi:hypothetical protein
VVHGPVYFIFPGPKIIANPPLTSAYVERSFLKLKLIKNYLRNTQEEEHLSDLAVLAIEANEAEQIDTKELIKTFSKMKSKKKNFE